MENIFKIIPHTENRYEISKDGIVRSLITGKILVHFDNGVGYKKVSLILEKKKVSKKYVHRLIALTYIPNDDNKKCVNHIDGNKKNNHVDNLEWCTYSENAFHAFTLGLRKTRKVLLQFDLNMNLIKEWESLNDAHRNGFNMGKIDMVIKGQRRKYKDSVWIYKGKEGVNG